jgi:hypothetical protein
MNKEGIKKAEEIVNVIPSLLLLISLAIRTLLFFDMTII